MFSPTRSCSACATPPAALLTRRAYARQKVHQLALKRAESYSKRQPELVAAVERAMAVWQSRETEYLELRAKLRCVALGPEKIPGEDTPSEETPQ